ncbi:MAG: isochorismatase hydrolase [Chloroflexi bacterium]|nr:isochorismatase hydrolase [Chloroflexota bacterium]
MGRNTAVLIYHFTDFHTRPDSRGFEPEMADALPRFAELLAGCRKAGVLVTYVLSQTARDASVGGQVSQEIAPLPGDEIIQQTGGGGAFGTPLFEELLRKRGRGTLLITGIAIDRGLSDTARRATGCGVRPIMVRAACFAQDIADSPLGPVSKEEIERVHLAAMYRHGIGVMTIDEVLASLR